MPLAKEAKKTTIETFKVHPTDTGGPAVQVALLTERINGLSDHFKTHAKDFGSRQGLLKLVGQRRRLLNYLKRLDQTAYLQLVEKLNLRK